MKKYGLEISQPGLEPNNGLTWEMTKRRGDKEVHMYSFALPFFLNFSHWCNKMLLYIMTSNFSLDTFLYVLANRVTEEKPGWCSDPHLPPCAAYALSLPPWFKVELMYCNIIYLDFLFFLYLVNFTISFVILDLWKLWHLSFLVRLGVVCGTWFRYILFSLLHMMAMVT